jgi:RNA recognition motif-containing protein
MNKLYVGNLGNEVTEEIIRQQFNKYIGKVEEVKLIINRHSETNYAFVKLQRIEDCEKAVHSFNKYISYNWTVYKSNDTIKE